MPSAPANMPEVTEAHRLAAFNSMHWAGWSYRQAMADPIRGRIVEARAHQLRKQQWQADQRAQCRTAQWFDAKAAMNTPNQYAYPRLEQIVSSLTNPRKSFDQAKLAELAESIKAFAVHTPILVRPLPASRLEDTAHLQPRPIYELVSGERRYRASEIAGKPTIPAIVSDLTDSEVLDIQLVENLQREDLSPLEEAEGYDQLMHHDDGAGEMTVEDVATKIGKSRSYVYARLAKLLDLGKVAPKDALATWVRETEQPVDALMLLVAHHDVEYQPWLEQHQHQVPQNVGLMLVAKDTAVDIEAIKEALRTKMAAELKAAKARENAEATKSDLPLNPAAQAQGGGGEAKVKGSGKKPKGPAAPAARKPKTSAEDARKGIAAAMQGQGEEGGADGGPLESDPAADGGGDDGRATSPDSSANARGIWPGDLVEILEDGPHKGEHARAIEADPDAIAPPSWRVDLAHDDEDMSHVETFATVDLKVVSEVAWPFPKDGAP